jgi:S-adenosylmethionine:tRNA ribosyltransferase-isomerase
MKEESDYHLLNNKLMLRTLNHRRKDARPISYTASSPPFSFMLPPELVAKEPPEQRGISRDEVKLMVINRSNYQIEHADFYSIGKFLRPGDLLVFNSSSTLPASLDGYIISSMGIIPIEVRLAEHLPDDSWLVLPYYKTEKLKNNKNIDNAKPVLPIFEKGLELQFGNGLYAKVDELDDNIPRLWKVRFSKSGTQLMELLYRLGQPIRYEYVSNDWNLDYYQNVYSRQPGSAEMPSAGRAFTWKLLLGLKRHGIEMTYITLHTGLSSYRDDTTDLEHPISEEEFAVNYNAAEMVNKTHIRGGRVIAVGTTVVRTLESVASDDGNIGVEHGYTRLHINANHKLKTVDGLLTGLHEPEASHLDLLTAFLSIEGIRKAYDEAIQRKYLWHEFGDLNLIL